MTPGSTGAAPRWVGVSMGDVDTLGGGGLGEFCQQVGSRLAASAHRLAGGAGRLVFHVHPRLVGCFGEGVGYLPVQRLHRHWHRDARPDGQTFALWHSLHQLNKHRPPQGAACRLVTVHDLNYLYGPSAYSRWRHHRRTRALLARSDALTAISEHTAADIRHHLGWPGEISVILNGARSLVGAPQAPLPGWAAVPAQPFLLHLSRMSPSKNPQALLALAAAWPEQTFVLAGPRNHDTLALQRGCSLPNLQFHLGITEAQKAWAYAQCSGFLFPSFTEGFGLPPVEAMHFGKPVFLSRLTSLPEVGGTVADYVDSFEPQAMRQVVERGLARHAADPVASAAALRANAARFDWDRAGAEYLALYERLLARPPA